MALGTGMTSFSGTPLSPGSRGASRRTTAANQFPTGQTNQYNQFYSQGPAPYSSGTAVPHYLAEGRWSGQQEQDLRANNAFDNRDLDSRMAELGIDRGANARDRDYYQNLLNVLGERRNIVGGQFNNTVQALQNEASDKVFDVNSQATASGGWFAPRRATQVGNIMTRDYNNQVEAADLSRRNSLQGLFEQQLGYERSQAQTGDQDAKLDIMAKQFGTSRERLSQSLQHGLDQLGYSRFINQEDLMNKLAVGGAVGEQAQQILTDAYQRGSVLSGGSFGDEYLRAGGRG